MEKEIQEKGNKYEIFRDTIDRLKDDWFNNIKPFIEFDKPQKRKYDKYAAKPMPIVGEPNPRINYEFSDSGGIIFTHRSPYEGCDDNPYEYDGLFFNHEKAKFIEQRKISNILKSLYFQYIQKVCTEINRAMLIVCHELGYKGKDFGLIEFYTFSDGLLKDKARPKIATFPKYNAFNLLFKLNNFLKHNTQQAYYTLKQHYPDNILKSSGKYENGMYAGDFIYLQDGYLDNLFDKLLIFFAEYCRVVLGETIGN